MDVDIILEEKEKEPNIYIKAMELGYIANDGISYLKMKEMLENIFKIRFSITREYTFLVWFLENFTGPFLGQNEKRELNYEAYIYTFNKHLSKDKPFTSMLNSKFFINGFTVKQYIDYLELTEARQQAEKSQIASEKALVKAKQSIWIAAGGLLVSVIISLYMHLSSPSPPFDVRVVEDNTITKPIEKIENIPKNIPEIDTLKKEKPINP